MEHVPPYETVRRNWSSLIRPEALVVRDESDTFARFVCEPLERGFGDTLGVALRRTLLRAIGGAAIVSARVELDGEPPSQAWVTELCLNLSEVIIDTEETPTTVRIEAREGSVVHGRALQRPGLRIVNPGVEVCVPPRDLVLELWIERGHGTKLSVRDDREDVWPVPAYFTPVRRVDAIVSRARIGQRVDFDQLQLDVITNGAVTPRQAVWAAAKILAGQLALFINFDERPEPVATPELAPAHPEGMFARVTDLELSVRLANCLNRVNVEYVGQLAQLTERQLMQVRGFGRKSLHEVHQLLSERNLTLGMSIPDWTDLLAAHQGDPPIRRAS